MLIGSNERIVFEFLDKFERITVKDLGKYANISDRRASRTLIKLVRANLLLIHMKDTVKIILLMPADNPIKLY